MKIDALGRFVKVPLKERFWSKVNKNGPLHPTDPKLGRCWLWTGARITDKNSKHHYGLIWNDAHTKTLRTHRVAWELTKKRCIPKGKLLLHSCDNPPCVNPDHVNPGTQAENVKDRILRGPRFTGERNAMARLTDKQVKDILHCYPKATRPGPRPPREKRIIIALCKRYDVTFDQLSRIARGERWGHIVSP